MTTAPPEKAPWYHGRGLPPLGLAYVAAALEKASFQVEILDNYLLNKSTEEVKQIVIKLNPEIVGMTCGSATYRTCVETAKAVKQALPSCTVVVGGWHPSYVPESMLKHPAIDYVVMGEGERAMVELASSITKRKDHRDIGIIAGVAHRSKGKIVKTNPEFISNLDQIPFAARHLLPMQLYERKMEYLDVSPVDTMHVIRGCPFDCAFCETKHLWGHKCRSFSPRRIVDEISHMVENLGSKGIYFISDNFTIRKRETIETCQLIRKRNIDIQWVCDTRVDLISRDLLREMKKAGCRTIWFGVETGSPRILKKINRGVTIEQTTKAFKLCRKEGINISSSFMLGIPGETINDMNATLKLAKRLNPDWCRFNIFVAYPDNILYQEIMKNHLYNRIEDFLVYVKTKDFDYEKMLKIQKQFHKDFYRSPKRILRKIKREGVRRVFRQVLKLALKRR
ncbi:radical SAM protein [Candidatus Bathyarchaeota archaeon]|nr:radical SAM protein [Candidatus Bathyarchaeota archaeon]